jgi:hypothetical protein
MLPDRNEEEVLRLAVTGVLYQDFTKIEDSSASFYLRVRD